MDKTKCRTYFTIYGEISISDISKTLNINNTSGYQKGDQKKYNTGEYEESSWEYDTGYEETLDGIGQASALIQPFLTKVDILLKLKDQYKCEFELIQVPIIENGESPSLGFSKEIIDFCSITGTEIQIDLYANPYKGYKE
ncbi:DUF4279 domain-containing protein [Fusibacter bizertensis]